MSGLSGWPLLSTPNNVTMQKCEKCSQEFFSPINYKRHIRIHRRSLNTNKMFFSRGFSAGEDVPSENRENLCSFIDKLSLNEQKELFSFNNVSLLEVNGILIIDEMISLIRRQWFNYLPTVFVNAGANLLNILLAHPSKFPVSSQTILRLLDDASEKTFLCTGNVDSLQKILFDGDVEKIVLDVKNVVPCVSFLLEQKLVRAFLDKKDAEALQFQKLLEEEEMEAQKRQTELLERKKQKKLRQKKHKSRKTSVGNKAEIKDVSSVITVDQPSCSKLPSSSLSDSGSVGIPNELLPNTESVITSGESLDKDEIKDVSSITILEGKKQKRLEGKKQKRPRQKKHKARKTSVGNKGEIKGVTSFITVDQISCSKLPSLSLSDGSVGIPIELLQDTESVITSGESLDKGEIKGVSSIITGDQMSCSKLPSSSPSDGSDGILNELLPDTKSVITSGETLEKSEIKGVSSVITVDQLSCSKLPSSNLSDGSVGILNELLPDTESFITSEETLDKSEIKGVSSVITVDQISCSNMPISSLSDGSVGIPNELLPDNESVITSGKTLDKGEIKGVSSVITVDQLSCSQLPISSISDGSFGIPNELLPDTDSVITSGETLEKSENKGVSSVITVDQLSCSQLPISSISDGSFGIPNELLPDIDSVITSGETLEKSENKGVSSVITVDQLSCSQLPISSISDGSFGIPNELLPDTDSVITSGETLEKSENKGVSSVITVDKLSCSKLPNSSLSDGSVGIPNELLPDNESVITLGETLDACGLQSEHCDLAIDDHRQCEIDKKKVASGSQIISKSRDILNDFQEIQTTTYLSPKMPVENNNGASSTNCHMVCTKKPKADMEDIDINGETTKQESYQMGNYEILIGSIIVSLQNYNVLPKNVAIERSPTIQNIKQTKVNSILNGITSPMSLTEKKSFDPLTVQNCEENEFDATLEKVTNPTPAEKSPQLSSIRMAEQFLIQRWKAALASNDVRIFSSSTT